MKYQDLIPSILARALKKLPAPEVQSSSPGFFHSYSEALEAGSGAGYEDTELVQVVFEKTRRSKDEMLSGRFPLSDSHTQSLLAVLYALQHGELQKQINVLDFGGACGVHYFQLRSFLPPDLKIDWVVVETPTMAETARALETSELHFVVSLAEAKERLQHVDLFHSSGALQYMPDPGSTVQEFMLCQPVFMFLNRLALSGAEFFITVQESLLSANGPGTMPEHFADRVCRYPVTYFPKHQLDKILCESYQIRFSLAESRSSVGGKEIIINAGMFLERHP